MQKLSKHMPINKAASGFLPRVKISVGNRPIPRIMEEINICAANKLMFNLSAS